MTGIEKQLIEDLGNPVLRHFFRKIKTLQKPVKTFHRSRSAYLKGLFSGKGLLMRKIKPDIVFSKGGFVSVPVVLAAGHKRKIPVIIHEYLI